MTVWKYRFNTYIDRDISILKYKLNTYMSIPKLLTCPELQFNCKLYHVDIHVKEEIEYQENRSNRGNGSYILNVRGLY